MKNKILTVAAAALLLAACGKKEQPAPAADAQAGAAQAGAGYQKKATYFKLPAAAGGELDLAAYAGKPVLVMFFTESCPYCRKAAPAVEKLSKAYGPKGLSVLGVCIEDEKEAALNFGRDLGVTFPLAYQGRPIYKNYKAQGVPYLYLLDSGHNVADIWEGYDESYDPQMIKSIEKLLAKK
jgi:thiol-disulfide isomerase/thioredoxin